MMRPVSATVTVMATSVEDLESFNSIDFGHRRYSSLGYEEFPARSGGFPHRVLREATKINLGLLEADPQTDFDKDQTVRGFVVLADKVEKLIPKLEKLVETDVDATAAALQKYACGTSDLAVVNDALRNGTWPDTDDVAAEAAAFAYQMLKYARTAVGGMGVCCEYNGEFPRESSGS